jgi:hypothetical protein
VHRVSIFISYAHEDQQLARDLASALAEHGMDVWIDEGELKVGDSIIERIATAIAGIDFFLALVSEASRHSNWCRKELALAITGELGREGVRVLPVRVNGAAMPDTLADVLYVDLTPDNLPDVAARLAADAAGHKERAAGAVERRATAGRRASRTAPAGRSTLPDDTPIRIVGIVEEGVGEPRTDGSRGSALYRVPLRLSRRPSPLWAELFVQTWRFPPSFDSMHRASIASVSDDTIVLDGTTLEELELHHAATLKGVLAEVNRKVAEIEAKHRAEAERAELQRREHEQKVRDAAARLKFDGDGPPTNT